MRKIVLIEKNGDPFQIVRGRLSEIKFHHHGSRAHLESVPVRRIS
jgi:hypothetical protein